MIWLLSSRYLGADRDIFVIEGSSVRSTAGPATMTLAHILTVITNTLVQIRAHQGYPLGISILIPTLPLTKEQGQNRPMPSLTPPFFNLQWAWNIIQLYWTSAKVAVYHPEKSNAHHSNTWNAFSFPTELCARKLSVFQKIISWVFWFEGQ